MRKIVGIGETVLDIIFKNDKPQDAIPGGSTFNALISLGRMMRKASTGVPVQMVTETGDDHIGDIVVGFMEENGVETSAVTRNTGTQSHISMAFLDSNNDAQYEFYKDHANAGLSPDKVDSVSFSKDDIVLFGSYFAINPVIRDSVRGLLQKARDAGAILYYDINFRRNHRKDLPLTMGNILENCRLADFVRGSAEDFRFLFGTDDGRRVYDENIAPLCRNFILTRGAEPIEIYQGSEVLRVPVEQTGTVSTIGAGDSFNAGFIYSLVDSGIPQERCSALGMSEWTRIVRVASKFSAAVCRSIHNYVGEDFTV